MQDVQNHSVKKLWAEHCFDYYHKSEAWMTFELLFDCLRRFFSYISSTTGRKAVLLLYKFSEHDTYAAKYLNHVSTDADNVYNITFRRRYHRSD